MSGEGILIITIVILGIAVFLLFLRLFQYKGQVKSFAKRTHERCERDVNQPVTVDIFQKEFVDLANALNKYTDKLKENNLALEMEQDKLNKVIAGISHDFRTPLTSARGYMQMVSKSNLLDEKNSKYQRIAIEKLDYLKELSDAFFEVAYEQADEREACIERLDIVKLLTSQLLGQYEWINDRGIKTDFNIPDKEIFVSSNQHMLIRIFDNLFSNAEKYSISCLSVDLVEQAGCIQIMIENDADNVDDIDIRQVFDLFYRDSSRTKSGSGIGLYVVKRFADKLGHKVWAETKDGSMCITLQMYVKQKLC